MKKLIKKLCILFVIVSALLSLQVLTGIYVIGSQYTQDYDAAMIDKVARLNDYFGLKTQVFR